MIGALSEEVYEVAGRWLTRLSQPKEKENQYEVEIILEAESHKDAVAEVRNLNVKRVAGERTILPTTRIVEYMGFQVPVCWSLCGECFTGTVVNGDLSQSFWSRDWEDFQRLLPEAVMRVILPEEDLSGSEGGADDEI